MPAPVRIGILLNHILTYGRQVSRGVYRFALRMPQWTFELPPIQHVDTQRPDWSVRKWRVDGVIAQINTQPMLGELRGLGVPVVNVATYLGPLADVPSVVSDNVAIGVMAAEHLLAKGLRRFGYVDSSSSAPGSARGTAFARAVEEAGAQCSAAPRNWRPSRGQADAWLASLTPPVGIFAFNDQRAAEVIQACRDTGLAVPEQVAVLGVDDEELLALMVRPPLSTVRPAAERVGFEAARFLADLLEGRSVPMHTAIAPINVVTRQSTDVQAIEDADVAAAVQFIREHAAEPVTVEDVLERVPVGRRTLEQRFRKALGRSPSGEIRRVHLDRARQLLSETELSVPEVARRSGFGNPWRFGAMFRRHVGCTPTDYRRRHRLH
jgi:LacI family transcriptional regulator